MKIQKKKKQKINQIKKSKRQIKITGLNINKDIEIIEDSIENNIPYRIKYQNYTFNIGGSRHENKQRITWYCQYYRKTTDIPIYQKKFCKASIQGIRINNESNKFEFYQKKKHSEVCLDLIHKCSNDKTNNEKTPSDEKISNKEKENEQYLINEIKSKKDFSKSNPFESPSPCVPGTSGDASPMSPKNIYKFHCNLKNFF